MAEHIKREDAIETFYTATGDGDKADWAVGVIKSIPSADVVSGQDFRDCRNELCLKCGQYQTKHLGSCNGCRWEKR